MFFLELDFESIVLTSVLAMIFALLAILLVLLVLRACGIRLAWSKRSSARNRAKEIANADTENDPRFGDISEEELVVLLTAAATVALGTSDTKRFRVVAFRRI